MQIQVNAADPQTRNVDIDWIRADVERALERYAERVTRVEVHLKDVNGPKAGADKQCTIEVRLAGLDPMAVTADGEDIDTAVASATGKLQRMLDSDLGRRRDRR